jgi:multicomponent Na+:H+ antiporter subunit B
VLEASAPLVGGLALLSAIVLYLSGHNAPGGGFIGGLLAAAAVLPYAVTFGRSGNARGLFLRHPLFLVPIGLLIMLVTIVVPGLLGVELLHTYHAGVTLGPLGVVEIASALVFDLGVFLTVIGFVLGALRAFTRM